MLESFVPTNWFKNLDESSYWLRVYSVVPVSHTACQQVFKDGFSSFCIDTKPIQAVYAAIDEGFKLPLISQSFPYSQKESGIIQVRSKIDEFELPASTYVFLVMPYKVDGVPGDEQSAKADLSQVEALFSLHLGNNTLRTKIFDGERAITSKGTWSMSGPSVAVPQKCDGPFTSKTDWSNLRETINALNNTQSLDTKNRINLALQFYQRGKEVQNSEEKFFFYWSAITVVTEDSGTMAVNQKFQRIYSKDQKYVEDDLHWKWAVDCRNDLFKRGKKINFHMQIERYFQMVFLELLRAELELSSILCLKQYIEANPNFKD